jgi:hypothetical protein
MIQAIVGDVPVLPHLTPPGLAALQAAFAESAAMLAIDPPAVDRWLLQLSHIRPAVERLDVASALTRLLGADKPRPTWPDWPPTLPSHLRLPLPAAQISPTRWNIRRRTTGYRSFRC